MIRRIYRTIDPNVHMNQKVPDKESTEQTQYQILNYIIKDDVESLSLIIHEEYLEKFYFNFGKRVPEIFINKPCIQNMICFFGSTKCFDVLYNLGFPFTGKNQKDNAGLSSIHYACAGGHLEIIRKIGEWSNSDLTKFDKSPLYYAALFGNVDVVNYIISKGDYDSNDIIASSLGGSIEVFDAMFPHIKFNDSLCDYMASSASSRQLYNILDHLISHCNNNQASIVLFYVIKYDIDILYYRTLSRADKEINLFVLSKAGALKILDMLINDRKFDVDTVVKELVLRQSNRLVGQNIVLKYMFTFARYAVKSSDYLALLSWITESDNDILTPQERGVLVSELFESDYLSFDQNITAKLLGKGVKFDEAKICKIAEFGINTKHVELLDKNNTFDGFDNNTLYSWAANSNKFFGINFLVCKKKLIIPELFKKFNIFDRIVEHKSNSCLEAIAESVSNNHQLYLDLFRFLYNNPFFAKMTSLANQSIIKDKKIINTVNETDGIYSGLFVLFPVKYGPAIVSVLNSPESVDHKMALFAKMSFVDRARAMLEWKRPADAAYVRIHPNEVIDGEYFFVRCLETQNIPLAYDLMKMGANLENISKRYKKMLIFVLLEEFQSIPSSNRIIFSYLSSRKDIANVANSEGKTVSIFLQEISDS